MTNPFNNYRQLSSESSADMDYKNDEAALNVKHPRPLPRSRNVSSNSPALAADDEGVQMLEYRSSSDSKPSVMETPLTAKTRVQNLKLLDDYPIAISTPKNETNESNEAEDAQADSSITIYERQTSASTTTSSDSEVHPSDAPSTCADGSVCEKENMWLSKPRKLEVRTCSSPSRSLSSGRSSPSVTSTPATKDALRGKNGRTPSSRIRSQPNVQRQIKLSLDYDAILRLEKLKLALNYVGVEPTYEQWEMIRSTLQATDASLVRFGDFVTAVKDLFQIEMDLKGITTGSIFFAASNLNNMASGNSSEKRESPEVTSQVEQLEQENQGLREQLERVKTNLNERLQACLLAEKEILFIRKTLQEVIEDNRTLSSRLSNLEAEKTQTMKLQDTNRVNQNEKSDHQEIYLIAASKLLQFTKIVHEVLSERKKVCVSQSEKQRSLTRSETTSRVLARKPIRVNRTASVQSASGDVSNYFARKYGGGGRICRAASTCTVVNHRNAEKENGSCFDTLQTWDSKDKLGRLTAKAQELITVFEAVLPAESTSKSAKDINSHLRRTKSANPNSNTHSAARHDSSSQLTIAWV